MEKNKKNEWFTPKGIFYILMIAIVVSLLLYFVAGFDILAWFGWGSIADLLAKLQAWLAVLFAFILNLGNGFDYDPTPNGEIPEGEVPCTDYNIASEYRDYFTDDVINTARTVCTNAGAIWTEHTNEISCFSGMPRDVDCSNVFIKQSRTLCESMNAEYVCDNARGLFGCFCEAGGADIPDIDENKWECGEFYELTGECTGYCEQGTCQEVNTLFGEPCVCAVEEGQEPDQGLEIRIFVTDVVWTGPLGGIAGADTKCNVQAAFAGLTGEWRAIISDDNTDAMSRVPNPRIPFTYVRMDGVKIADSHADLFDGSIDNRININEKGEVEDGFVWTGSTTAGVRTGENCANWGFVDSTATVGTSASNAWSWIDAATPSCSTGARIYCVEVV